MQCLGRDSLSSNGKKLDRIGVQIGYLRTQVQDVDDHLINHLTFDHANLMEGNKRINYNVDRNTQELKTVKSIIGCKRESPGWKGWLAIAGMITAMLAGATRVLLYLGM